MTLSAQHRIRRLGALSVPLRQDVAVTGSVDRHGCGRAVGGINEQIEGFCAACRASGLIGTQDVVIPAAGRQRSGSSHPSRS